MPNSFLDSFGGEVKKTKGGNKFLETATPEQHFYTPEVQSAVDNVVAPAPIAPSESHGMFQKYQDWSTNTGRKIYDVYASLKKNEEEYKKENPILSSPFIDPFGMNKVSRITGDLTAKTLNTKAAKVVSGQIYDKTSKLGIKGVARLQSVGEKTYDEAYNALVKKSEDPTNNQFERIVYGVADSGLQSAAITGISLIVGALTKSPIAGRATAGALFGGVATEAERREKGAITPTGVRNIAIDTAGDVLISNWAESALKGFTVKEAAKLLSKEGLTAFSKNTMKAFGIEGSTEVLQSYAKIGNEYLSAKTPQERLSAVEKLKNYVTSGAMLDEFLIGGVAGGIISGGVEIAGRMSGNTSSIQPKKQKQGGTEEDEKKELERVVGESGIAEDINTALETHGESEVRESIVTQINVTEEQAQQIIDIATKKETEEVGILNADDVAAEVEAIAKSVETESRLQAEDSQALADQMEQMKKDIETAVGSEKKYLQGELEAIKSELAKRTDEISKQITEKEQQITTEEREKKPKKTKLPVPKLEEGTGIIVTPKAGGDAVRLEVVDVREDGVVAKGQAGVPMLYSEERFDVAPVTKTKEEKQIDKEVAEISRSVIYENLGKQAYGRGETRDATGDINLMKMLQGKNEVERNEAIGAWERGWDKDNVTKDAPVIEDGMAVQEKKEGDKKKQEKKEEKSKKKQKTAVDTAYIAEQRAKLQEIYDATGPSGVEGFTVADEELNNLLHEMELAEPGQRSGFMNYNGSGPAEYVNTSTQSTFPKWLDEDLRSRELFDKVVEGVDRTSDIQYPEGNRPKQRKLVDGVLQQLDVQLGIDTSAIRNNILAAYEGNITISEGQDTQAGERSNKGEEGAPRGTETQTEAPVETFENKDIPRDHSVKTELTGEEMGASAFARGIISAPAQDPVLMDALKDKTNDERVKLMKDWMKGWTKANLEAPTPEVFENKQDEIDSNQKNPLARVIMQIAEENNFDLNEDIGESLLSIENPPYMDLSIERQSNKVFISHIGLQNGDIMRDPEIMLEIVDGQMIPRTFTNDYANIQNIPVRPNEEIVTVWAENLLDQGFARGKIIDNGQPANERRDTDSDGPGDVSEVGDVPTGTSGKSSEVAHDLGEGELANRVEELGAGSSDTIDVIEEKIGKKGRQSINEQVKALLEAKNYSTNREDYTSDDIGLLKLYSGAGGKESVGAEGKGLLSEFYTPNKVVQKTWELALQHAGNIETAFEPSAGTGRYIMLRPEGITMDGIELDRVSGTVAQIINEDSNIEIGDFQSIFFQKDSWPEYDLVIGNPPYGARGGFIKGKGEEPKIDRWEEYFIKRGLDMTKEGGIVAYVVNSSFLQKGGSKGKEAIAKVGKLEAAYRLPEGTFEDTTIGTDIVIFRKEDTTSLPSSTRESIVRDRINLIEKDEYFISNPENILGETKTRTNRFGKEENYVTGDLSALDAIKVDAKKDTATIVQSPKADPKPAKKKSEKAKRASKGKKTNPLKQVYEGKKMVETTKNVISATGREYTKAELDIWKRTERDGSITGMITEPQKKMFNFAGGKWYSDTTYYSGNISQRLAQLELDKAQMETDQYERQKAKLLALKPTELNIEDISFDPLDRHITNMKDGERTILRGFTNYLQNNNVPLPGGVYSGDIIRLVTGGNMRKDTKELMPQIKDAAKRLFNFYIKEVIPEELQQRIVTNYNETKNSVVNQRYADVPVVIEGMSKTFKGKPFELSATQKRGVSFLVQKGAGILAWGVGVGKTLGIATATVANMQAGRAKRPMIAVPKATIDKTWIDTFQQAFPGITIVNLGGLTADVVRRLRAERGEPKDWIKDGEIAIISHNGLLRLGFKEDELRGLVEDLNDALWSEAKPTKTKRGAEEQAAKIDEIAGHAQRFAKDIMISDLGIDHISVDEVHNHRKVFQGAKASKEDGAYGQNEGGKKRFASVIGGTPSARAVHLFLTTQYIQKKYGGNVFLASATPFENHATEVYNILSFVARDRMKEMGIFNINDFFAAFADFVPELEIDMQGKAVMKEKMKNFKNLPALQSLLREYVDRREDPTLIRPERRVLTPILGMSELQEENLAKIQMLLAGEVIPGEEGLGDILGEGPMMSTKEKEDGAFLIASQFSIANSVSPYFVERWTDQNFTPEDLVENSPKIKYAMELIKGLRKDPKTKNYGTFLYFGKHGKNHHQKVKDYIVKHLGFKESEVQYINGDIEDDERETIKDNFNTGEVKVLIGGDPTKEGIDLQNNGYVTINLALGWNPTEPAQVEGRVWRQGNKRSIAPLVYPLVENSGDVMIYGKFEEKGGRINDLFSYQGDVFDVSEIDPQQKKIALLTNPEAKAQMEIEYDRARLDNERVGILTEQKNLQNLGAELVEAERHVERVTRWIEEGEQNNDSRLSEWRKERDKYKAKVKRIQDSFAKKNVTNVESSIDTLKKRVEEIEEQIKTLSDTYKERLLRFTNERAEEVRNRKSIGDHVEDFFAATSDLREYSAEEIAEMRKKKMEEIKQQGTNLDFRRRDSLGRFATETVELITPKRLSELSKEQQENYKKHIEPQLGEIPELQEGEEYIYFSGHEGGEDQYVDTDIEAQLARGNMKNIYVMAVPSSMLKSTGFPEKDAAGERKLKTTLRFKALDSVETWLESKIEGQIIDREQTLAILKEFKERLKLDFNVQFFDRILTGEKAPALFSLDGKLGDVDAWGVTVFGGMAFTEKTAEVTPAHEVVHFVLNNLDKMPDFGVTKEELNAIADDETIARGFETYWKTSKSEGFNAKIVAFFKKLAMMIREVLGMKVTDAQTLQKFYYDVMYMRRFGPTVRQKTQDLQRYTYVRDGEIVLDFEGFRTLAEPSYKRKTIPDDLVAESDILKVDLIRKDINLLNDITAQARDIYLKDTNEFKAADIFQTVADTRRIKKSTIDRRFADMLAPYFALTKEDKKVVNVALVNGDRAARKWNKTELANYGVTSAKAIGAYYKMREAFEYAHDMLIAKMEENGVKEEEIEQFRNVRKGYIPHRWEGRYVVKTQEMDDTGVWRTVSMQDYKTEAQARREYEQLNSNDNTRYILDTLDSVDVDFFTAQHLTAENVISAINRSKVPEEFRQEVVQGIRDMSKEKGFGRYYIRRTNISGYETENMDKIFADYFSGLAGYVTKMEAAPMYFKALQTIDPRRQKKFYAWLRDTIAYDMGNSPELNVVKQTAFIWMLANDISYLMINATQNMTVGIGELSKYINGAKKIAGAETALMGAMVSWWTGKISAEERGAVEFLLKNGRLGGEMTSELMGFKSNPIYRTISNTLAKALYSSTSFVESNVNRVPAFIAARRVLLANGADPSTVDRQALSISDDIHFRYGKQNRPRMERGRAGALFVFTHWTRSFLYQLSRDLSRREFMSLGKKMFYTALLGGVAALPFAKMWLAIYREIVGDDDDELKTEIGTWEIALMRGLPATTGVDLSSRVSIDIFQFGSILSDPTNITKWGGAGASIIERFSRGYDLAMQERYYESAAKLLPDGLGGNFSKAYAGYTYGVRSQSGRLLERSPGVPMKYTPWEAALRGLGFTPTMENIAWERRGKELDKKEEQSRDATVVRRKIESRILSGDIDGARKMEKDAIAAGTLGESSTPVEDIIEGPALLKYAGRAYAGENAALMKKEFIREVFHGETLTPQKRAAIDKKFDSYAVFGSDNKVVADILGSKTNTDKVKVLLKAREDMGADEFAVFFGKAKRTKLISDDLSLLYRKEQVKKLQK